MCRLVWLFGVYVYCPFAITWVSFTTGYRPCVVGWFMPMPCWSLCYWVIYPSLLDKYVLYCWVGYLSVCYWVCDHQFLVTVCRVLLGRLCLLSIRYYMGILHYWIQYVHYCWVGIFLYVIGFVSINYWFLPVCVLLGSL